MKKMRMGNAWGRYLRRCALSGVTMSSLGEVDCTLIRRRRPMTSV